MGSCILTESSLDGFWVPDSNCMNVRSLWVCAGDNQEERLSLNSSGAMFPSTYFYEHFGILHKKHWMHKMRIKTYVFNCGGYSCTQTTIECASKKSCEDLVLSQCIFLHRNTKTNYIRKNVLHDELTSSWVTVTVMQLFSKEEELMLRTNLVSSHKRTWGTF